MVIEAPSGRADEATTQQTATGRSRSMTTIRTSCSLCGDVELVPGDLALELVSSSGTGSYVFCCPHCDELQRRPASHRVVSILLATGVAYQVVDEGPDGPITESEIASFAAALEHGGWERELHH
jgi:hypothetical protein